jgi:hypothetical protein
VSPRNPFAIYIEAAGGAAAGVVLAQIAYWWRPSEQTGESKLQFLLGDTLCLIKSSAELGYETGLTERQVRRALDRLVDCGFIRIERHLWKHGRGPTNHIVLDQGKLKSVMITLFRPNGKNSSDQTVETVSTKQAKHISKTTSESTTGDYVAVPATSQDNDIELKTGEEEGKDMKLDEIQAALEKKKTTPTVGKKNIATLWKGRVSTLFTGDFHKELTSKERGQLQIFAKKVGPTAYEVLEHTLLHWSDFCATVQVEKGVFSTPTTPVVGYVLQYHDVAVNLYMQAVAKPTLYKVKELPKTQLSTPVAPVKSLKSYLKKEEPASKEFVLAMMAKKHAAKSD